MGRAEGAEDSDEDFYEEDDEGNDEDEDELAVQDKFWRTVTEYCNNGDKEVQDAVHALMVQLNETMNGPPPTQEEIVDGKLKEVRDLYKKYKRNITDLVNTRDHMEQCNITCLMHAAAEGHIEIVTWLVAKGADPRAREHHNISAMHLAAYGGHAEVCVELYCHAPEMLHWRDDCNSTPVMRAVDQGEAYTSQTLVSMGAHLEFWGPVCEIQKLCDGMRWPILEDFPFGNYTHICPLCKWGFILPEDHYTLDPGHPLAYQAALPPEFYPNPFKTSNPPHPYHPPRAGPCWTPPGMQPYNGTGVPQRWLEVEGEKSFQSILQAREQRGKKRPLLNSDA